MNGGEERDSDPVYLDVEDGRLRIGGDLGVYVELLGLFKAEVVAAMLAELKTWAKY